MSEFISADAIRELIAERIDEHLERFGDELLTTSQAQDDYEIARRNFVVAIAGQTAVRQLQERDICTVAAQALDRAHERNPEVPSDKGSELQRWSHVTWHGYLELIWRNVTVKRTVPLPIGHDAFAYLELLEELHGGEAQHKLR
ncbi:MAG: hypothetical protein WC498_00475 [Candidatus Saccharimonadales bacterium]